jgi:K+-sensing histidine kinase KdpD
MATLPDIAKEIELIKQRNKRVEADKAWETSWSRKAVIAGVTYVAIALFLLVMHFDKPFQSAIVPTIGFLLANMTIPFFKNLWFKYIYKK